MNLVPMPFCGRLIRIIDIDGEPWFVGADVAEVLGYANAADAIAKHCKGVAKRYPLQTPGGMQELRILAEPDVMRLIVRSKLPAAEQFERWVFEDVLPRIRRTGSYGTPNVAQALNDPATLRHLLLDYAGRVEALEAQVEATRPDVEALDELAKAGGSLCLRDAAKAVGLGEHAFIQRLQQEGWIYRRPGTGTWYGYSSQVARGRVVHKVYTLPLAKDDDPAQPPKIREQVRLTAKGIVDITRKIKSGAASSSTAAAVARAQCERVLEGARA